MSRPDAQLQAANLAFQAGRLAEAERTLRRLLRIDSPPSQAAHLLGLVLHAQGREAQALTFLDRARRESPDDSQVENNRATVLNALGRPDEALAALDRALLLRADDPGLHYNRGNTLLSLGDNDAALAAFDRAIALRPDFAQAWQNRGVTLTRLGRPVEALETYDRLIALMPHPPPDAATADLLAEIWANKAWALDRLNRRHDALAACDRGIALAPDLPLPHWNAAPTLLAIGDYERGWQEWEWRWRDPSFRVRRRAFAEPLWLGHETLQGRRILLHAEQGFGDTLQFCRYVPMVKARGASVTLEVPAPLEPLMRTLEGPDVLIAAGRALPSFDYQTPLMSLPLAFGTRIETIPARVPYLAADPARLALWRERLGEKCRLRIGLAWSGNPGLASDGVRSAPLADLAPLFYGDIDYVAVQKDVRARDRDAVERFGIRVFTDELRDFADTAALIALTDLVISVDSGPAHLAGALGHPVWLLLYWAAEWRWLEAREDSPWYPSARLFRQRRPGDWTELAARVGACLGQGGAERPPAEQGA